MTSENNIILERKGHLAWTFCPHPVDVTGSMNTLEIFFGLFVSQRYVQKL